MQPTFVQLRGVVATGSLFEEQKMWFNIPASCFERKRSKERKKEYNETRIMEMMKS
jgi:hypothetical protein